MNRVLGMKVLQELRGVDSPPFGTRVEIWCWRRRVATTNRFIWRLDACISSCHRIVTGQASEIPHGVRRWGACHSGQHQPLIAQLTKTCRSWGLSLFHLCQQRMDAWMVMKHRYPKQVGLHQVEKVEKVEKVEEEKSDLPLELKWPGVHRVAWGDKPEVGSQANSSSPRYAPFRYGAAIVRQQRGIHGMAGNGPPSSRGSSRLQRSASQQASQQSQSHSQQTQQTQQQSQNSHPSHPSRSLSHPSGKNSRSISGSGPKGSDSRSRDVDVPPIELIPPYYMTQNTKNTQRGESKNSARMQQKAFEHIAALSNVWLKKWPDVVAVQSFKRL